MTDRIALNFFLPVVFIYSFVGLEFELSAMAGSSQNIANKVDSVFVDEIIAVIPNKAGDVLVCASQLHSVDGRVRTVREVVVEAVMHSHARDLGMECNDSVIDSIMANLQKIYKLSREQLLQVFEEQGYLPEEVPSILKRRRMIDDLVGLYVHVREITQAEFEEEYHKNPIAKPSEYKVQLAFLDYDVMDDTELKELLKEQKHADKVDWDEVQTYEESQLTPSQMFVKNMKPGEVVCLKDTVDGYELVRLVEHSPENILGWNELPDLKRNEIINFVRQQVLEQALREFQESLLKKIPVLFRDSKYAALMDEEVQPGA